MASPPPSPQGASWSPYQRFSDLLFVAMAAHFSFAALYVFVYNQWRVGALLVFSGALAGGLLPLFRTGYSACRIRLIAHAAMLLEMLSVSLSLVWVGLRADATVWWVVWWPMMVAHVLGLRDGLAWVPVTLLAALGLWANDVHGWVQPLQHGAVLVPLWLQQLGFLMVGIGVALVVRRAYDGYQRDITRQQDTIRRQQNDLAKRASDLEDMLQALQQANLERTRLFAQLSHEVRTPLNGVLGFAQLLGQTPLSTQQASHLNQINQCGATLLQMVNEILDFSRLESRPAYLDVRDFDAVGLVREALDMVSPLAAQKGIDLRCEFAAEHLPVAGDPLRIKQVVLNLLANAVKFTAQGEVQLRCQRRVEADGRAHLRIEVQDSGIGVPERAVPHLFQPFSPASDQTAPQYGGSGLGLAICKRLVDMMGGVIGVSSQTGRGSLFWFEVPADSPLGMGALAPA